MTKEEFKRARKLLGYNTTQMASALGLAANGSRTIERIETGANITGPMRLAVLKLLDDAGLSDKYKHMIQGLPRKGGEQ